MNKKLLIFAVSSFKVPIESRGYLLKMLGKDGFLDLMIVGKALTK
jgi:hypothetical protein